MICTLGTNPSGSVADIAAMNLAAAPLKPALFHVLSLNAIPIIALPEYHPDPINARSSSYVPVADC